MSTATASQTPAATKGPENKREKPFFLHHAKYPYYIIDGKVYDLADWIPVHPGGVHWFIRSHGRDISAAVHAYHENQELIFKILKKYEVDMPVEEATDPKMNGPPHVMPEDFNIKDDMIIYDFSNPNDFLSTVRRKMNSKEWK